MGDSGQPSLHKPDSCRDIGCQHPIEWANEETLRAAHLRSALWIRFHYDQCLEGPSSTIQDERYPGKLTRPAPPLRGLGFEPFEGTLTPVNNQRRCAGIRAIEESPRVAIGMALRSGGKHMSKRVPSENPVRAVIVAPAEGVPR